MLKINDSVIIEYPGLAYHQRRGRITGTMTDDFLGKLDNPIKIRRRVTAARYEDWKDRQAKTP